MPKLQVDYSKGVIYKIISKDLNITDLYIGSTTDFRKRKHHHKSAVKNINNKKYDCKIYQFIRANGGWDNWDMIEIQKYPCKDGNELRKAEREQIEQNKATLNSLNPYSTAEERQDYLKQYKVDNHNEILLKQATYHQTHKEQEQAYRDNRKDAKREYDKIRRENKKEELKTKRKQYYEKNKEEINARRKINRLRKLQMN
jgi:hypothetical protein